MPWFDVIWTEENERHIAEAGLSVDDVEYVLRHPAGHDVSRSSGRPLAFGIAQSGRPIIVVYEQIDAITVYPVTAYELE